MRATIVIAAHNEGDLLGKTIHSVKQTAAALDTEIVVVDDASTDGSVAQAQRDHPDVRVESFPQRAGVSRTKDRGARVAQGEVLIFLDGHCNPEPGALTRLVEDVELASGEAVFMPRICALDPETWQNNTRQVGHGYQVRLDTLEVTWQDLERLRPAQLPDGRAVYETPTFIGCVVAMSRRLYTRLHGFDTDMLFYGSEDVDLGVQCWLLGHTVYHDPVPLVGHRFQQQFDHYTIPPGHTLANQLRMARRTFSDNVWESWLPWFRERIHRDHWESSWQTFRERRESVERERQYLFAHRAHSEFWYSERFSLAWPAINQLTLPITAAMPSGDSDASTGAPSSRPSVDPSPLPSTPPSPMPPTPMPPTRAPYERPSVDPSPLPSTPPSPMPPSPMPPSPMPPSPMPPTPMPPTEAPHGRPGVDPQPLPPTPSPSPWPTRAP